MGLIVQKFGGTSVADSQKILRAARKAIRAKQQGNRVVMVVSAMGHNTDMLIALAKEINERPPAREMDMLLSTGEQVSVALMAMAIESLGHRAVSLTGGQIGIRTDSTHTKARILSISTERMHRLLDEGNIVIAAGFQGIDEQFNITTLGRGGSDTTAVALAAVLRADACEIYTDVDGVFTTDPRVVPEARRVDRIGYDEMLELASLGAGVMHNRSIEFAKKYGVSIHVRSSVSDAPGTLIEATPESRDAPVCGAAVTKDEARVTLTGVPDVPGTSHEIFSRIAARHVTVDMIVQNVGAEGRANISFTVPRDELAVTLEAVAAACEPWGHVEVGHDVEVAKVSVVGLGMARQTGVAHTMFGAIADAGINIQMITTSEIKISVLVDRSLAHAALRAVHTRFALDQPPPSLADPNGERHPPSPNAADVVMRLRDAAMEHLAISDVSLDDSQARVTIIGVPDQPGLASRVFRGVAEAGVFVDMIVQSYKGKNGKARLSFTVPRRQIDSALAVTARLQADCGFEALSSSPSVAKLSVSGIGLHSHTGVAIRMFRALAEIGVNVAMISTSEVRVNVVVSAEDGERGLKALQEAFADARL
ncbi:MAG: aspartate kinase [Planctomycetes bacterium]|nr:aspartate kinase [Planctomycetota bacterium]